MQKSDLIKFLVPVENALYPLLCICLEWDFTLFMSYSCRDRLKYFKMYVVLTLMVKIDCT